MLPGHVFMRFTQRDFVLKETNIHHHRECVSVYFWRPSVQFVRIKVQPVCL